MEGNINRVVPISEAERSFSKIARLVDRTGTVVISKRNVPRYVILELGDPEPEYVSDERVAAVSRRLMEENAEAYSRLARGA